MLFPIVMTTSGAIVNPTTSKTKNVTHSLAMTLFVVFCMLSSLLRGGMMTSVHLPGVAQKRGIVGLKTSQSSPYNHTASSTRANGSCFISVKNSPLVSVVQYPM